MGTLRRLERTAAGASLHLGAAVVTAELKIGDSVAVSGPCLTVTAAGDEGFTAFAMPETLDRTTLGALKPGAPVNLERALTLESRLGGHLVSGHIDAPVLLSGRRRQGGALLYELTPPQELLRYIAPKGSVALDGVSLTVIEVGPGSFSVGVIPHTAATTTLGSLEVGGRLNLEVDLLARYLEKLLAPRPVDGPRGPEKITMELLREQGYL